VPSSACSRWTIRPGSLTACVPASGPCQPSASARRSRPAWSRSCTSKNYPYPDLVKGYQSSPYDLPLVKGGWIEVTPTTEDGGRRIRLERVHLEEDTGKLAHSAGGSLVDYNRSGVPLMEMVFQPDLRSPAEARADLQKLRAILRTLASATPTWKRASCAAR